MLELLGLKNDGKLAAELRSFQRKQEIFNHIAIALLLFIAISLYSLVRKFERLEVIAAAHAHVSSADAKAPESEAPDVAPPTSPQEPEVADRPGASKSGLAWKIFSVCLSAASATSQFAFLLICLLLLMTTWGVFALLTVSGGLLLLIHFPAVVFWAALTWSTFAPRKPGGGASKDISPGGTVR